jgi:hypothetical protein
MDTSDLPRLLLLRHSVVCDLHHFRSKERRAEKEIGFGLLFIGLFAVVDPWPDTSICTLCCYAYLGLYLLVNGVRLARAQRGTFDSLRLRTDLRSFSAALRLGTRPSAELDKELRRLTDRVNVSAVSSGAPLQTGLLAEVEAEMAEEERLFGPPRS